MLKMLWGQLIIEMKLFVRDRPTVFWTFFFPVFMIFLFGFVFNKPEAFKLDAGIADEDRSQQSHELLAAIVQIPVLNIEPGTAEEMRQAIQNNDKGMAIIIPKGYADSLNQRRANIEILYNPAQQQFLQILHPLLLEIVNRKSWEIAGMPPPIRINATPIQPLEREQSYIDFLVPGLIGFSLMATCLFSVGVVVVSYREKGKLRRLAVTPLPKSVFITGQILNRYFIVLLQAILLIGISIILFNVQMVGSLFQFFIALTVGMFAFIALGYAVASVAQTPETASGIANVLFIPMTFLSGVYFSVEGLPGYLQPLIKFLPLTHLVKAIRSIFNQGVLLSELLPEMGILAVWMVASFVFSLKKFKWE
jgi:ABC-2 type transport system permease protein